MTERVTDEEIHLALAQAEHTHERDQWITLGHEGMKPSWDEREPCEDCMELIAHLVPTVRLFMRDAWHAGWQANVEFIRTGVLTNNPYLDKTGDPE